MSESRNDYRKMLMIWEKSKKLKQLIMKKTHKLMLNKKEINKIFDAILDEDLNFQDNMDFIQEVMLQDRTDDDVFVDFIKTITQWNYYLKHYQNLEEFEICSKIKKVIAIEQSEYQKLFNEHFKDSDYTEKIILESMIEISKTIFDTK